MSGTWLSLSAIDTWMFRDGRPFGQDDPGASRAVSVFPPYPPTVVGALRAAVLRRLGEWNADLLGDGVNWQDEATSLGKLSFGPPVLHCHGDPLFPAPLHLVRGKLKGADALDLLRPKTLSVVSDLGDGKLFPAPKRRGLEGIKPASDYFVTQQGIQKILEGEVPNKSDLVKTSELWSQEERIGIELNRSSRTVKEGQFYMAHHVRPDDRKKVGIAVEVQGWQDEWTDEGLLTLGGEHRMAALTKLGNMELPSPPNKVQQQRKVVLIAISPVVPDAEGTIPGLDDNGDLEVVSACTGKPVPIGGWDSRQHCGLPLRRCWPAGSVWFVKVEQGASIPESIGVATNWGFGRVLAGLWPQ